MNSLRDDQRDLREVYHLNAYNNLMVTVGKCITNDLVLFFFFYDRLITKIIYTDLKGQRFDDKNKYGGTTRTT